MARSTQLGSSMVTEMMSSTNLPIEAFFASMSTASLPAWTSGSCTGWYSSSLSSCTWGDWSYVASHDFLLMISFTRSIASFLTVVYSTGTGVVKKGKRRNRREELSMMEIHVDAIRLLMCMWRYAASRSVFLTRIIFYGHLIHMAAIMWIIMRRKNL